MKQRHPTSPGIGLVHDAVCCQACRQETTQLRIDNELLWQSLETEKEYGRADANNLTKLEGRVDALDEHRARISGRNEILDQVARDKAFEAKGTADTAHKRAGNAKWWALGIVLIIEALDKTRIAGAIIKAITAGG
jgi:hypothetical protein